MSVRMKKWVGIIQEAANSGLTKSEFCAQRGINRRQFFDWQKWIRQYVLRRSEKRFPNLPENRRTPLVTMTWPPWCEKSMEKICTFCTKCEKCGKNYIVVFREQLVILDMDYFTIAL